jgi:hypothetical protein
MAEPRCICDFGDDCDGSGVRHCEGCGGDFCVCHACHGNGEVDCAGCEYCCEAEGGAHTVNE